MHSLYWTSTIGHHTADMNLIISWTIGYHTLSSRKRGTWPRSSFQERGHSRFVNIYIIHSYVIKHHPSSHSHSIFPFPYGNMAAKTTLHINEEESKWPQCAQRKRGVFIRLKIEAINLHNALFLQWSVDLDTEQHICMNELNVLFENFSCIVGVQMN